MPQHQPDSHGHERHDSGGSPQGGREESHGGMERGVSRPMDEHGDARHHMSREDRLVMLTMHHRKTLWVYWTILLLGAWIATSPER